MPSNFLNSLVLELNQGTEYLYYNRKVNEFIEMDDYSNVIPSSILNGVLEISENKKYNIYPTDLLDYRKESNHTVVDSEVTLRERIEDELFSINTILSDIYNNKFKNDPDPTASRLKYGDAMIDYYLNFLDKKYGSDEDTFKYTIVITSIDGTMNTILNKSIILVND